MTEPQNEHVDIKPQAGDDYVHPPIVEHIDQEGLWREHRDPRNHSEDEDKRPTQPPQRGETLIDSRKKIPQNQNVRPM